MRDFNIQDIQKFADSYSRKHEVMEINLRVALYEAYCAGFLKSLDLDPPDDWIRVLREDAENP